MNYTPSGVVNQTSCKDCLFAIYNGNTQIGCEANRIEKFKNHVIEAYDDEKEFYVLNRLCNLYRFKSWNNGEKDLEKARSESSVVFDIIIDCDNIDDSMRDDLIDIIKKIGYNKHKITLLRAYNTDRDITAKLMYILHYFPNINISMYFEKQETIYSILSKSIGLFHVIVNETNYTNLDVFMSKINSYINEDLKQSVLYKSDDKIAILNFALKVLFPNLYLNYDENMKDLYSRAVADNLCTEF